MQWFRRLAFVAVVLVFGMAVPLVPATAADDYLLASDPLPHQQLKEQPGWVTLAFKSKASAKLAKILVLDSSGKNVTSGALIVEGTNVTTQLAFGLPKGTYTVHYRTSDQSGQPRGGAFQFAYGSGNWTAIDKDVWVGEAEEPPVISNPDPNATETPTALPSPSVTPTPSSGATDQPTSAGPSTASAAPNTPAQGSDLVPWLIGGGLVVVVVAAGAGYYAYRTRKNTP
jgi:methionine-rich copper-binding protein CopC